jgi:hypothetical protein
VYSDGSGLYSFFFSTQQANMIGRQKNNQSLMMQNKSDKMIIRGFLLASAIVVLICLITPASSLPLEGAFGENENRFRCK